MGRPVWPPSGLISTLLAVHQAVPILPKLSEFAWKKKLSCRSFHPTKGGNGRAEYCGIKVCPKSSGKQRCDPQNLYCRPVAAAQLSEQHRVLHGNPGLANSESLGESP